MNRVILGPVAALALLSAGCGAGHEGALPDLAAGRSGAAAAEYRMSPGKPRPPVVVTLEAGQALQTGVPAEVRLQVSLPLGMQLTQVAVDEADGLSLQGRAVLTDAFRAGAMEDLQVARFSLAALPMSGGSLRLRGTVHFTVDGVAQAAPFNVRVPVEGPATVPEVGAMPPSQPVIDATGEVIHSMKAETTVH